MKLRDDPRTERHIGILEHTTDGRVITAIELPSPANKSSEGVAAYHKKQAEFISARVNLVEIDLIRGGHFVLALPERKLPRKCQTPYSINVRRATQSDEANLYRVTLRDPLPTIPIPLRPTDRDAVLQLQSLLDECIERGRYHLKYQLSPDPPLAADEEVWADQLLREHGLRVWCVASELVRVAVAWASSACCIYSYKQLRIARLPARTGRPCSRTNS